MLTLKMSGQLLQIIDEEKTFVADTGQKKTYQKRVMRILAAGEFCVIRALDGVALPGNDMIGKTLNVTLVAFTNEKDVVRATICSWEAVK